MNIMDRVSLFALEGLERLNKFARFEEKMRSFASPSKLEGEAKDLVFFRSGPKNIDAA
jgi:hypothetical protein